MSIYNIDIPRLYFDNINIETLPISIRNEFEKVAEAYESFGTELGIDNEEISVAAYSPIIRQLSELVEKVELFITIDNSTLRDEKSTIDEGFEKLYYKNLDYYKVSSLDYMMWFLQESYSRGFVHGYKYKFNSDYEIFSTVYKRLEYHNNWDNLLEENYNIDVISEMYLSSYGLEKGKFIKAWTEILNRPQDFKLSFEVSNENSKNIKPLQWFGGQTELIELTKALIENGNLKGDQNNIYDDIQKIFNFKLNHIDQAITKYNSRPQGEETKFINKLQKTLLEHIQDKLETQRQNR